MNARSHRTTTQKTPTTGTPSDPQQSADNRDPAEVRAESFRVAGQRETVEAFVVAFILALLFRAFLAEAFVIPTGSMAPTLMGAHKDIACERCGISFQFGASRERSGPETDLVVVAGICPNCRYVNPLDLANDRDDDTFNGDRILVSKFSYMLNEPDRWDVIVFKYPGNPKQNYIKRLVGLPNETVSIRHGDVYAKPTGSDQTPQILRKPASTLLAMSHLVYDTNFQSPLLIQANYPSRWQPWADGATEPPTDSWQVQRTAEGMTATVSAPADQWQWLRYFHRWPGDRQWDAAEQGQSLADVDPYSGRAVTDFYSYDSYVHVPAGYVYKTRPAATRGGNPVSRMLNGGYSRGEFSATYQSGEGPEQFGGVTEWGGQDNGHQQLGRDGMHWVGDLILEADIETATDAQQLMLELVEAGVKYRCTIALGDGTATLSIDDVEPRSFDNGDAATAGNPTAATPLRSGGRHQVRFSNCDDELLLWVDDELIAFDRPTTFDARRFRTTAENHPHYMPGQPMDAAPAALAVRGGGGTVRHLKISRDKYYIATNNSNFGIFDYDMSELWRLAGGGVTHREIQDVFAMPERWDQFVGWDTRRIVSFELDEDQFFPMGDNSPESLDARCWAGTKSRINLPRGVNEDAWRWSDESYVPRDLLVGKALVVFWPHSWNSPVPFTPNFQRMKLIR